MKPITQEWVDKAEADFATARRETRALCRPNLDAACFHAQQSAEKYLKALLQEIDIPFPKTHDLLALLDLATPSVPELGKFRDLFAGLSAFAILFRYPGERATRGMAREAVNNCRILRRHIRESLGLSRGSGSTVFAPSD